MRRIRIVCVVIFVLAVIVFGLNKWNMWINSDATGAVIQMEKKTVTVSVADDEKAILSGITASDEKDGDVTESLIIENYSNFIEKGRRNVTIAAFDSDNHVTKETIEVVYSDYRSPKFTLSEPLKFPRNTSDILTYVGAEDVLDGSLTSNIKISTDYSIKTDTAGEYSVVFTVSNSAGDVSELPATVQIYDNTEENQKPKISLSDYIVYTKPGQAIEPWNYVKQVSIGNVNYTKGEDGSLHIDAAEQNEELTVISAQDMVITNQIDFNKPGVYEILYQLEVENRAPGQVRLIVVVE